MLQVLQGLRASASDNVTLQGRAHVEEGQSIGNIDQKCKIPFTIQAQPNQKKNGTTSKLHHLASLYHSSGRMARIRFDRTIISIA